MTEKPPLRGFRADQLSVEIHQDRESMGAAAATLVARRMRELLARQGIVRMVFASAPSQVEFLDALSASPDLDWRRVVAFHMDEYIGLSPDAPQSFGRFIRTNLWDRVGVGSAHVIRATAERVEEECARYAGLLSAAPLDIVCMGIGENGHIAFNDPPVADFQDPRLVKAVDLELRCRQQQVNDGCFPGLNQVPTRAITLTVPALMSGGELAVVVPAPTKADAVFSTLREEIGTSCPASVLRRHPRATLFLDPDSARRVL